MKPGRSCFKATVIGGLLFMLPLILMLVILQKGVDLLRAVVQPLARLFPVHRIAGVGVTTLLAIAVILILSFAFGLLAQTGTGRRVREWLEWTILGKVPGYTILKSVLQSSTGPESEGDVSVVLARIEDAWQLAFRIEAQEDGHQTVFVPGAPSPTSGSIYYLTPDRVPPAGIPMHQAIAVIRRLGVGSKDLLKGKLS